MQPCGVVSDECVGEAVGKVSSTMSLNFYDVGLSRKNVRLYLDISVCIYYSPAFRSSGIVYNNVYMYLC